MNNINIRNATKNDITAMAHLLIDLFSIEDDFDPDFAKHKNGLELLLETNSAYLIVAVHNNKVIGMCTMQTLISTAEGGTAGIIEDVIIEKAFRGNGIGSMLMKHMERIASEKGIPRLQLLADKNNTPALEFYKLKGWMSTNLICLRKKDF